MGLTPGEYILFVGRLVPENNAHLLMDAYEKLDTDWPLVIVGDAPYADDYIAGLGARASDRILMPGYVFGNGYAELVNNCGVMCVPTEVGGTHPVIIEAMAAGLPVVVSDWDGYRDTVRDGIDGFRIPTLLPQAGWAGDLAFRHALEIDSYDMYCGHTCSLVAVDVAAATQAFTRLFQDAELRQQMGEAGRIRAREVYDWKPIIQNYERLWASLRELRTVQAAAAKPLPHPWPARMDPFHAFARYPTQTLTPATKLERVDADMATASRRVAAYRELAMVNFAHGFASRRAFAIGLPVIWQTPKVLSSMRCSAASISPTMARSVSAMPSVKSCS
jgi:hypothetical protein